MADVGYDPSDGLEILHMQIQSCFEDLCNPLLLDFAGRRIISSEDIEDIKVVELIPEALCYAIEDNLSPSGSNDWEQHIDPGITPSGSGELIRATSIVNVWVLDEDSISSYKFCTNQVFLDPCIQPYCRIVDTTLQLCRRCSNMVSPDLRIQGDGENRLGYFKCDGKTVLEIGLGAPLDAEETNFSEHEKSSKPVLLFLLRNLLHEATSQSVQSSSSQEAEALQAMMLRLQSGAKTVMVYEDHTQQNSAREHIDFDKLKAYTQEYYIAHTDQGEEVAMIHGLLRWFKQDFFKWCNDPACSNMSCSSNIGDTHSRVQQSMEGQGASAPSSQETADGWASRTELYKCRHCSQITRFPRYNNPSKLLETRKGRCGEWANCFCLICRALSLDARWVLDLTDHVWVEIWMPSLRRYVHVDPCEAAFDSPLMYETGWNKQLTYIFSFSRHGVVDSTSRYTRKLSELIFRRGSPSERAVENVIAKIDSKLESDWKATASLKGMGGSSSSLHLDTLTLGKDAFDSLAVREISLTTMERRKRLLAKELLGVSFMTEHEWKIEETQGRGSGSLQWRRERGEIGHHDSTEESKSFEKQIPPPKTIIVNSSSPSYMFPGIFKDTLAGTGVVVSSLDGVSDVFSLFLGGKQHGDTKPFIIQPKLPAVSPTAIDKVQFKMLFTRHFDECKSKGLDPAAATAAALIAAQEELARDQQKMVVVSSHLPSIHLLHIYAGKNFINGVQCEYNIEGHVEQKLSDGEQKVATIETVGQHDAPQRSTIDIQNGDRITRVGMRYGNIVDSLTVTTAMKGDFTFGGAGGEFENLINIPDGFEVAGFFGGIGGHLHYFGVILGKVASSVFEF